MNLCMGLGLVLVAFAGLVTGGGWAVLAATLLLTLAALNGRRVAFPWLDQRRVLSLASVTVALLAALAGPALAWSPRDYHVGLPLVLRTDAVGARDLQRGQWLSGVGVDMLWLHREDEKQPIFYLSGQHLYNASEQGKGSLGAAFGVNTGKAGEVVQRGAELLLPDQAHRLKWLTALSNWVSVEASGGYRVFGTPQGQSPWVYAVGGKVRIPLERLWGAAY